MGRIADRAAKGPRVLTIDIECSAHTVRTWGLHDQNIGLNQIVDVGSVICFAAKWYDERKVRFHSDHHDGHDAMVAAAWSLMDEADYVIGYNSRAFDCKHLHREFILAGMPPPSPHKDVDLLTVVRSRAKFASGKLDHVADQLGIGTKTKHSGFDLWTGWERGDPAAIRKMRQYNIQDVKLTEALYDRLRPWIKNHPHPGLYGGDLDGCPNCGGRMVPTDKPTNTASRQYVALRCVDCGANARTAAALPGSATSTRSI